MITKWNYPSRLVAALGLTAILIASVFSWPCSAAQEEIQINPAEQGARYESGAVQVQSVTSDNNLIVYCTKETTIRLAGRNVTIKKADGGVGTLLDLKRGVWIELTRVNNDVTIQIQPENKEEGQKNEKED